MQRNLTKEIQSNDMVAKEYQDWVNNPMTQAVYDELLRHGEPLLLVGDNIRGETSLYMLGLLTGWRRAVEAMVRLGSEPISAVRDNESEYREEI